MPVVVQIDELKRLNSFSWMPDWALERLAEHSREREIPAGEPDLGFARIPDSN